MPRGLQPGGGRSLASFTLAEWQQSKRSGIDPRWTRQVLQECWQRSDSRKAFGQALQDRGLFLARGDRRGVVVLDHQGAVHALAWVLDVKTKEVRDRLGDGAVLPSVAETQALIGQRMMPALKGHIADSRARFAEHSAELGVAKDAMTQKHHTVSSDQEDRQKKQRERETVERAARLPKGLRGLWHRITGQYQQMRAADQAEAQESRARQAAEREALVAAQQAERAKLQKYIKELRRAQAEELRGLREDIGRYLRLSGERRTPGLAQGADLGLKLKP